MGNRIWLPTSEPICGDVEPIEKGVCGFNIGHDGDHCDRRYRYWWKNMRDDAANWQEVQQ